MAANALNHHLALAGFMGAGKTTLGQEVARRLRRRFVDLDHEIERQTGATISAGRLSVLLKKGGSDGAGRGTR